VKFSNYGFFYQFWPHKDDPALKLQKNLKDGRERHKKQFREFLPLFNAITYRSKAL